MHEATEVWDDYLLYRGQIGGDPMGTRDRRFLLLAGLVVVLVVSAVLLLMRVFGLLGGSNEKTVAAALTFLGVVITACVSLIGLAIKHQAERRLDQAEDRIAREQTENDARLRLDAAMRAGTLFNVENGSPAPAAAASGLLALTELGRADLAVALLVDLWHTGCAAADSQARASNGNATIAQGGENGEVTSVQPADPLAAPSSPAASAADVNASVRAPETYGRSVVSNETAILVLDEALQADARSQLVAAEVLCRNASGLDICQSLHWPPTLDDSWDPSFGVRTKILLVEALIHMARAHKVNQNALQWLTVRLYGISLRDPNPYVKGCLGILLSSLLPALDEAKVESLMFGRDEISIDAIRAAAAHPQIHKDRVFVKLADQYAEKLRAWSQKCDAPDATPGSLAASVISRPRE